MCDTRQGYSGVATFTRIGSACPVAAEEGVTGTWAVQSVASPSSSSTTPPPSSPIGHNSALLSYMSAAELRDLDNEGRCVITDHGAFLLFNVYVPNAGESRNDFKIRFLELLSMRIRQCQAEGREVVVVGDINISATRLDHCKPQPFELDDGSVIPFEESPSRRWWRSNVTDTVDATAVVRAKLMGSSHEQQSRLVDVLRAEYAHQRQAYTCWDTLSNARAGNFGARIDYILASLNVASVAHSSRILSHVLGSDHCPVQCEMTVQRLDGWRVGSVPPALCSQWWPELSGQQKKLSSFFTKLDAAALELQQQQQMTQPTECDVSGVSAVSKQSANKLPLTHQKRAADSSAKSTGRKKTRVISPAKCSSPPTASSLLSYFSAPQVKLPVTATDQSASEIDATFLTDTTSAHQHSEVTLLPFSPVSVQPTQVSSPPPDAVVDLIETYDDGAGQHSQSAVSTQCSSPSSLPLEDDSSAAVSSFSRLFTQSSLTVLCHHGQQAKMWQVNKKGPNNGRQFYCCVVPLPDRCSFWKWLSDIKKERNRQSQHAKLQQKDNTAQSNTGSPKGEFVSARTMQARTSSG